MGCDKYSKSGSIAIFFSQSHVLSSDAPREGLAFFNEFEEDTWMIPPLIRISGLFF
jgi:hypothetical protein